jgi:transposase-like protein
MQDLDNKTIKDLAQECQSVDDILGMMKKLFQETLQLVFEAEIEDYLGYSKHSHEGDNSGNSRNGFYPKTINTKFGKTPLSIPRDRNGNFEPQIVKKYETSVNGLEETIIALYSKGMSTRDIEDHMNDIYGVDVSPTLVSKVTDKILPEVLEWQTRPLEVVYPIVFLDAIHFKVRHENQIINKAAYTVLGINSEGIKDILGIWIGEDESASFWLSVLTDLKSRGVKDMLIACKDGLSGFTEAIEAIFPKTRIQLCVIHQLRNNSKHILSRERKDVFADLRKVYKASTLEQAELEFEKFKKEWGEKYKNVVKSWKENWLELTAYFDYPTEIRNMIYTTNTVESFHRQLRKVTKTKTAYPTDNALKKIVYLAIQEVVKKWGYPVPRWVECKGQFQIIFGARFKG